MPLSSMILAVRTPTSLIFSEWCMSTLHGLSIAIVVSLFISICIEGLQEYRSARILKASLRKPRKNICGPDSIPISCKFSCTLAYVCQIVLSYYLMLSVMTGNIWIFIAVISGSAIGFFIVRPWFKCFFLKRRMITLKKHSATEENTKNFVDTKQIETPF
eukprot:XP_014771497.1 PREDICTED: probable low affinity copper uptake protein 2 [Octopus bimaculoides]